MYIVFTILIRSINDKEFLFFSNEFFHFFLALTKKLSNSLIKLGIRSLEDLLFHFPIDYLDRTKLEQIADLTPENDFVIRGEIEKVSQTFVPRKMLLVKVKDNSGHIFLRFFYYFPSLRNIFKEGANIQVAGKSRLGRYGLETIHPDYEILKNEDFMFLKLSEPVSAAKA